MKWRALGLTLIAGLAMSGLSAQAASRPKSDWLHTKGNRIVDARGKTVRISGVNWFGYNTGTNTFDGVWTANLDKTVKSVANHGFNTIRVPFSVQLLKAWSHKKYPQANINLSTNAALKGKNSLQIWSRFLADCQKDGLKVIVDIHSAKSDPQGQKAPLWKSGSYTTKDYYAALSWLAKRYKKNDTIIGYDLKNEPHGMVTDSSYAKWDGSKAANNWRYIAAKAGNKVLKANPHALVFVEGVQVTPKKWATGYKKSAQYNYALWGANLRGVAKYPVKLKKRQLVYSIHDYGPSVAPGSSWVQGNFTYNSLMKNYWRPNWYYIHANKKAPLYLGEWGGYLSGSNLKWMKAERKLIKTHKLNFTYWCLNNNSADTGGLLNSDWTSWNSKLYRFVKPALWQSKKGQFYGLDGQVKLGSHGLRKP